EQAKYEYEERAKRRSTAQQNSHNGNARDKRGLPVITKGRGAPRVVAARETAGQYGGGRLNNRLSTHGPSRVNNRFTFGDMIPSVAPVRVNDKPFVFNAYAEPFTYKTKQQ